MKHFLGEGGRGGIFFLTNKIVFVSWLYKSTYLKTTTTIAIKTITLKTAGMTIANFDFDFRFFSSTILNDIKEILVVVIALCKFNYGLLRTYWKTIYFDNNLFLMLRKMSVKIPFFPFFVSSCTVLFLKKLELLPLDSLPRLL